MQMRNFASAFLLYKRLLSYGFVAAGDLLLELVHKHGGEDTDDAQHDQYPADRRLEEAHDVVVADS